MISTINKINTLRKKSFQRLITVTIILCIIVLVLSFLMLYIGNTIYPLDTIISVLQGEDIRGASFTIMNLRLPRMFAGLLSGLAFGAAGYIFQTVLRNPLASPDVIGVTSGSSLAAVVCISVLHASAAITSSTAIVLGISVTLIIYLLSNIGGYASSKLILIGIGVQAMISSLISYILLKVAVNDVSSSVRWLSGSLNSVQSEMIILLAIVVIIFIPLILVKMRNLKILELGEASAISLGINPNRERLILVILSVFLIAFATATTGPIAFVAFLSGPISKRISKSSSNILPSALVGAILVLLCDLIGQFAFETKFPVGVITGVIGAPYLIYLLIKQKGE